MDYTSYTDSELIALIKHGDVSAFTQLYNRHFKLLHNTAYCILRNSAVTKDIIQEVFTSIWQNRANLEIAFPKAYLQQAVRFQVFKAIRAEKTDEAFYQRLFLVSQDMVIDNVFSSKELQRDLDELIESLPVNCKTAFRLSRDQNLTYKQIAERLNISVKTVEKNISKSLRYLRVALHNSNIFL